MTVVILKKLDLSDILPLGDFCSKQAKSQVRKFRLQKEKADGDEQVKCAKHGSNSAH